MSPDFSNGAVSGAIQGAMAGSGRRRAADNDNAEPESGSVSNRVRTNRSLRDNVTVSCNANNCDVAFRGTIGGDYTVTDDLVNWAANDIRGWAGDYVEGARSYKVTIDLTVVERNPDILITAVDPSTITPDANGMIMYPAGQALIGKGGVIELGLYGQNTAAHEFGHLLGLSHQSNATKSIMSYSRYKAVTGMDIDRFARAYGGQ